MMIILRVSQETYLTVVTYRRSDTIILYNTNHFLNHVVLRRHTSVRDIDLNEGALSIVSRDLPLQLVSSDRLDDALTACVAEVPAGRVSILIERSYSIGSYQLQPGDGHW